jgi:hypothetical protein
MSAMRGTGFLALLLAAVLAAAQDAPREFQARNLCCSVALPAGWKGELGATGMAARDASGNGFVVTREPFLQDAETFANLWAGQLRDAKLDTKVERTKACGRDAWRAAWTAGDRQIEVWRVYAPEAEMLYNFSFSGATGFDLKALVEPTLKSFKCTAPKAELKFQGNPESVTTRVSIRLPEGFEKEPDERGFQLGGGIAGGYVRALPGYDPPHVAGRIRFQGREAGAMYQSPDGKGVMGGDVEKLVEYAWQSDEKEFQPVAKKPKPKDATFAGLKGSAMEAAVVGKNGMPQRWMVFVGKFKQDTIEIVVIVDEREARLYKDYLKQLCSNLVVAK